MMLAVRSLTHSARDLTILIAIAAVSACSSRCEAALTLPSSWSFTGLSDTESPTVTPATLNLVGTNNVARWGYTAANFVFSLQLESLPNTGTNGVWSALFSSDGNDNTIEWTVQIDQVSDNAVELAPATTQGPQIPTPGGLVFSTTESWQALFSNDDNYRSFTTESGLNYVNIGIPQSIFRQYVLSNDTINTFKFTVSTSQQHININKDYIGTGTVSSSLSGPQAVAAIPEPATWLMMMQGTIGLGLFAARKYRRKRLDEASGAFSHDSNA